MDTVYYKKLMSNGAVTLKFKIDFRSPSLLRYASEGADSNVRGPMIQKPDGIPLELSSTHHDSNCARCYKLKKKCSRTYPSCDYCRRLKTVCEYIDRRKRRLTFEQVPASDGGAENYAGGKESSGSSQDLLETQRHPILIASLVNPDSTEQPFRNIELHPSPSTPSLSRLGSRRGFGSEAGSSGSTDTGGVNGVNTAKGSSGHSDALLASKTHSRMALAAMSRLKPAASVAKNIVALSTAAHTPAASNLNEEFLAVRPIADVSLPLAFVHTFFANYEWKYPFLSRHAFFKKLENLSFQTETLVGLDVYLVMAIGCLIHDANLGKSLYPQLFSDSFVESIVDMISYDIKSEDDIHKAHLLILLLIYAINVGNTTLIWNIVGFLDRLVLFLTDFTGRNSNVCMKKRCFWTIFNLDKELSLLLDKPSQFMPTLIIKISSEFTDTLLTAELEKSAAFMSYSVRLHSLQDRMLGLRLGLLAPEKVALNQFSADLEVWRVGILLLTHTEYAELSLLQNYIGLVNLDYYYLLIELDQLSSTESCQFTLQFLSNSFSLLLSDASDKKESGGTSIYSLFWFLKFFKVIDYSVASLLRMLDTKDSKTDLVMRLYDFNGNVQLETNLLKFLLNSKSRPQRFVEKLELYLVRLKALNLKLVSFNPLNRTEEEVKLLTNEIKTLFDLH